MHAFRPQGGVDPRLTEELLLKHPDVVDASVFWSGEVLTAQIVLGETAEITPRGLKAYVCEELGLHQTPREIICQMARYKAA